MMKPLALATLFSLLLFAACGKKSDDPLPPKAETTSKLLGKWQMTNVTLNGDQREPCERDNIYEFKDKNVFVNDPQVLCGTTSQDEFGTGEYEVSEDGNSYKLIYAGDVVKVVKITELKPDRLVLNWLDAQGRFPYDYQYTFQRSK